MKSKQLLSIVFSVIMFTGVTAGSVAFAESDDYDDKYGLDDRLENFCDMTNEEKRQFFADHPRLEQFSDRLANYCDLSDYSRDSKIKDFIRIHVTDEDRDRDFVKDHVTDEDWDRNTDADFRDKLARWCEMSDEDKEATAAKYDKTEDQIAKADRYCTLNESDRADFIADNRDEFKTHMKDRMHDKDIRGMKDRYCEMSDEDKLAFVAEHDKAADHVEKMNEYCSLDDDAREDFAKDLMRDYDFKKPHMDYDKLCSMEESDRALEITDVAKLDRISEWCEMTPEEREDFKRDHKGDMKDKKHDFDGMSDMAKGKMDNAAKAKLQGKMIKFSEKSDRLKAMIIMPSYVAVDERMDEIKMKFKEKHGDLTDAKKSELKMKFKNHMASIKVNMSDDRRSAIHDRIAEMKAFKADLRDRASDLTDEEKQTLRADFIDKAKDMQLAWISPRTQMTAGLDAADVECREGFSLVMKASNGVAMCLKADTALKMIDRGIAVPAN